MDQKQYDAITAAAVAKGITVDEEIRKILEFFVKGSVWYFASKEPGEMPPAKVQFVSERLGISEVRVQEVIRALQTAGVLEETKGLVVPGGREYWFGIAQSLK